MKISRIKGLVWIAAVTVGGYLVYDVATFLKEKPEGAWLPEQVAEFLLAALERGDFYVLCPDNDVTPEMDRRRIAWGAGDLTENRPALSRWHPDYEAAFAAFMDDEGS